MKNYRAYSLISVFTPDELNLFESFLKSPYLNTRQKPLQLFQIISKNISKSETPLTKQKVFEILYKDKKFNSNTFNDLMSQLHKLVEDFLYINGIRNDKRKKEIFLLKKYLQNGYHFHFENKHKQLEKLSESDKIFEPSFFQDLVQIATTDLTFFFFHNTFKKVDDFFEVQKKLMNITVQRTTGYMMELATEYLNTVAMNTSLDKKIENDYKKIIRHIFNSNLMEPLKSYSKYNHIIDIYGKMIKAYMHPDNYNHYFKYKAALQKNKSKLTFIEILDHYGKLVVFCTLRINLNKYDEKMREELKQLTLEIIQDKYYKRPDINLFPFNMYRIFLNNLFTLKDEQSIRYMIAECVPSLEEKYQPSLKNLSEAYSYFLEKDYLSALSHLEKVNRESFQMNSEMKTLYIKIHYYLKNTEQILSLAETHTKFLMANKIILKDARAMELAFLKSIRHIVIAENQGRKKRIMEINESLQKNFDITNRDWLLEITEEYLNK
ncbi:MAG: hypothetical protein JST55_07655 [Bacteroidetes bacterium]|nr:hypothetical protein [Bacteroidota bacterium]